jgi:peroxiredoxin
MRHILQPGDAAPLLSVDTVQGAPWSLQRTAPAALDLVAIYRGAFCPFCKGFVSQLAARRSAFIERGILPIAISMDGKADAARAFEEWNLHELTIGYGLTIEAARRWGIYLTTRPEGEQLMTFCEPAVFLVRPDKKIYALLVQSLPCGRPDLDNLIQGLDFLAKQGFPARGTG